MKENNVGNEKIAVVAGASRGAGKGIALALAEIGATVYVVGRSTNASNKGGALGTIEMTSDKVNKLGGAGIPVQCDCSKEEEIKSLFNKVEKEHGRLDLLVNSAWGGHDVEPVFGEFYEHTALNWEYMFNKGVRNYLLCSCLAAPLLMKTKNSLLINISFWDDDKYTGSLYYDLSKNAMNRMVIGFGKEMYKHSVTAISLSPGYMRTERVMQAIENDPTLTEKFGVPTESTRYVGRAVAALLMDENKLSKTGGVYRVGDLAREYDFYDIDNAQPEAFTLPEMG